MSHFSVAVLARDGQTVDELLAPYDENLEVEPYVWKTRAELEKEFLDCKEKIKKDPNSNLARIQYSTDPESQVDILGIDMLTFARWYYGKNSLFDEEGNLLTTRNPNSKWDWYTVGGRWWNLLITKQGNRTNVARIKDIDWEAMEAEGIKNAEKTWKEATDKPVIIMKLFYGIKEDDTKETYLDRIKKHFGFCTFAVVTPDGTWHEKDQDEKDWLHNYKKRFIDSADPDWWLVILDCHI